LSDSPEELGPVVVDTDVFSLAYLPARPGNDSEWRERLFGRTIAVAVQTAVELRSGARMDNWSARRLKELDDLIAAVHVVPVSEAVQASYVRLTVWARQGGHAIHQRGHAADRWIAATAMAWDIELASGDGIFDEIDGLRRLP
jgi:predicted nucleic acid-binding protein